MIEIDKEYFCSCHKNLEECDALIYDSDENRAKYGDYNQCDSCQCKHRKWPTPEQFKEEYGRSADKMPFYAYQHFNKTWSLFPELYTAKDCTHYWAVDGESVDIPDDEIVIACTPYGVPPADYRAYTDFCAFLRL